jgi:hypothetical protein
MKPAPYSPEYFEAVLGPDVMADIHRQAAEAPVPSPEVVERVRRAFAPTVARLAAERAPKRRLARAA